MSWTPDLLILPYEVLADDRLTLRQLRVLMAITSWRKANTNLARVSREMLSERTGYPMSRISEITTQLVEMGWLIKRGDGGRGKWSYYALAEINSGDEQTEKPAKKDKNLSETNSHQNGNGYQNRNGYQNGIETVTDSVSKTVTNSVTHDTTERSTERVQGEKAQPKAKKPAKNKRQPVRKNPPTFDEVFAFAEKKGNPGIAKKFFDYFEAGDWRDAKGNDVFNWKQKMLTWLSREEKSSSPNQTQPIQTNGLPKGMRWAGGAK